MGQEKGIGKNRHKILVENRITLLLIFEKLEKEFDGIHDQFGEQK